MSPSLQRAVHLLRTEGGVTLPGERSTWSRTLQVLVVVLMWLVGLLAVGAVVAPVVVAIAGVDLTGAVFVSVPLVLLMLLGLGLWLRSVRRRRRDHAEAELLPVTLDRRGIVLRGVGPIPWSDVEPARRAFVRAEHDTGWVRRAVMPLTAQGFSNLNTHLPSDVRDRLGPHRGPAWAKRHTAVYVPAVQGLAESEVMDLINTARAMSVR